MGVKTRKWTLKEAVEFHGTQYIAKKLGVTRAAIYQAIEADRKIYVFRDVNDSYYAAEIKFYGAEPEELVDFKVTPVGAK